ncbi:MAG TPA: hypothetical protein VGN00_12620 [Puia sp.]|jgi:hypothetical protein
MENHHQATLKSYIGTLSQKEKDNVKSHVDAAGDDHNHPSAGTVTKWVVGIVGAPAVAGLGWKALKTVVQKHL